MEKFRLDTLQLLHEVEKCQNTFDTKVLPLEEWQEIKDQGFEIGPCFHEGKSKSLFLGIFHMKLCVISILKKKKKALLAASYSLEAHFNSEIQVEHTDYLLGYFHYWKTKSTYIIFSWYSPYPNLEVLFSKRPQIVANWRKQIFFDIIEAIISLHQQNLVHRDIKLGNIIYFQGRFVLIDFEFVKHEDEGEQYGFSGTPNYLAPEGYKENTMVRKSLDIWALGVTFFFLFGKLPFLATTLSQIKKMVKETSPDYTLIPENFRPLLQRMLHKDPDKRPTIYEVKQQLEKIYTLPVGNG